MYFQYIDGRVMNETVRDRHDRCGATTHINHLQVMDYFYRYKVISGSIVLMVTLALSAAAQVTNQNLFDTIPFLPEHYRERVALFNREPVETGPIVFLGNSITEGGDWKKLTGEAKVINRGIGGDITFGVLQRLDDITRREPFKLFILIGINDIGKDIPDEVIADNCRKIIEKVKAESPSTRLYLQSILPVNPGIKRFPQHYDKENHIVRVNELLKKVALAARVNFVNLYPLFLDDQQRLDKRFTGDGLHINEEGYKIWIKFLKETGCL
jgi:lysophospholipase L1-like esterase